MRVQVIRAWPDRFETEELALAAGATVADALAATRITQQGVAGVAVHGERVQADTPLHEGDRLELLGPLLADPKDSRRRRAQAQAGRAAR
ncbi:RnfH family protein [Luteimonas kalidii]|uniref:UPF0125 protein QFW81_07410 n=1 Tax=Luteimonas kalidii TaxID=3042025 RepID=A0ABT6JSS9_9GAMM|nr:RnfH family protein [Luteimonas kalidii]MDH5833752.1 RnfH family protein [Luteimonas kalidii]